MTYRITYSWGEKDILPSVVAPDTAVEAYRAVARLKRAGFQVLRITITSGGQDILISPYRLEKHARMERGLPLEQRQPRRRLAGTRKAIASAILGIIASALPNSFGDFGVVTTHGGFRGARTTRALRAAP